MDLEIAVSKKNVANFELAYSRASAHFRSKRVMKIIGVRTKELYTVYNIRFERALALWYLGLEFQKEIDRALFADIQNIKSIY